MGSVGLAVVASTLPAVDTLRIVPTDSFKMTVESFDMARIAFEGLPWHFEASHGHFKAIHAIHRHYFEGLSSLLRMPSYTLVVPALHAIKLISGMALYQHKQQH